MVEKMKIEDFVPIDDRIIIRPHGANEQTKTGVYLPPSAVSQKKEIVQSGEIVAVGPGRVNAEGKHEAMMDIRVGDVAFFARFQGWLFVIDDVEYRVFGQHDIFGRRRRDDE